jgi:hypothetical protein
MSNLSENGSKREISEKLCVYYDGYWIKFYEPPTDNLAAKKRLIEALTRRLFNHMEHGINVPGKRLGEARRAFEREQDPERRRVKRAMLAGALFNRAADIFTKVVELQALGVDIDQDDALMKQCGDCLLEALELGKSVRHRSSNENIDELWGEPFKAFSMPIEAFYESRYVKIAQTMRDIDRIAGAMALCFAASRLFPGVEDLIGAFADAAKRKCETLRTDPVIFDVWTSFVVAGEKLLEAEPKSSALESDTAAREAADGVHLIKDGKELLTCIARARVSMPNSTQRYLGRCERYSVVRNAPVGDKHNPGLDGHRA